MIRGFKGGRGPDAQGAPHVRGIRLGIDMFIQDGAYTTVAAAVSILVVLTLVFSVASAIWSLSRSGDIQVSADNAAMAGANVVSSYHTAATVVDASIATMGFAGMVVTGAGMVGTLVPPVSAAASSLIDAGIKLLSMRNRFAASASKGLQTLEKSLPYLVAAQAGRIVKAQDSGRMHYAGLAMAVPKQSASKFPAIEEDQVNVGALEEVSQALEEVAQELTRVSEDTARAKGKAWLADCGSTGMNMQERADRLAGLNEQENPDYASSIDWEPIVALNRSRAYYRRRLAVNVPENASVEARADAAARAAFYRFALDELMRARIEERDGHVVCTVSFLPKNTAEVRATTMYTDRVWPSSHEPDGLTLHYGTDCPGITGAGGSSVSLADIDGGSVRECAVCKFSVGDLGKTPAASTSIDNGFEYHFRRFVQALNEYVACRNKELELERKAKGEATNAGDTFEDALAKLVGRRPRIAPPGRYGCVSCVVSDAVGAPEDLEHEFAPVPHVGRRGAIAAAALAFDPATRENNVMSQFFSTLEKRVGADGISGALGAVMDVWGSLLVSYGDIGQGIEDALDNMLADADQAGAGPVARWLRDRLVGVVRGLGLDPPDISMGKPVLTDSHNVISRSDVPALHDIQQTLRSIPLGTTDPAALLEAVGYGAGEYLSSLEFTLAEIPLPGGKTLPLTIRLKDVLGGG